MTARPAWRNYSHAAALPAAVFVLLASRTALASPYDRASEDYTSNCGNVTNAQTNGGNATCNVCGQPLSESCGTGLNNLCSATWGSFSFPATQNQTQTNSEVWTAIGLYCSGSGGTVIPAGQMSTLQAASIGRALGVAPVAANAGASSLSLRDMGGRAEISSISGASTAYGVAIPASFALKVGQGKSVDVPATFLAATTSSFQQVGINAVPSYRVFSQEASSPQEWRWIVDTTVPLQFVTTAGSGLSLGLGYLVGAGGLVGAMRDSGDWHVGGGLATNVVFSGGFNVPVQISLYGAKNLNPTLRLAVQPGLSAEMLDIGDTLRGTVGAGLELGGYIFGLQGSIQSGIVNVGLGVTYVTKLARAAEAETPGAENQPAAATVPSAGGVAVPTPATGLVCMKDADCPGELECEHGACVVPVPD